MTVTLFKWVELVTKMITPFLGEIPLILDWYMYHCGIHEIHIPASLGNFQANYHSLVNKLNNDVCSFLRESYNLIDVFTRILILVYEPS